MSFQTIVLCASAFLVQSIAGQYLCSPTIRLPVASCGCGSISIPSNGGSFLTTSIGPIAPSGLAAATELTLAADLAISGTLPFLSAVAFDGQFPTSGAGSVSYGCGDGNIAITQELGNPGGNNAASSAGLALNSVGLNSCGCGCRYNY